MEFGAENDNRLNFDNDLDINKDEAVSTNVSSDKTEEDGRS